MSKYRSVNSTDTSLSDKIFEHLVYVIINGNFETFTGYMGPVIDAKKKNEYWVSDPPNDVGH